MYEYVSAKHQTKCSLPFNTNQKSATLAEQWAQYSRSFKTNQMCSHQLNINLKGSLQLNTNQKWSQLPETNQWTIQFTVTDYSVRTDQKCQKCQMNNILNRSGQSRSNLIRSDQYRWRSMRSAQNKWPPTVSDLVKTGEHQSEWSTHMNSNQSDQHRLTPIRVINTD